MKPLESTTLGQDLKFGSWGRGTVSAIITLISIVVLPMVILRFIGEFSAESGIMDDLEGLLDTFEGLIYRFAIYGSPLVLLAFFNKSYQKGSKAQLLFALASMAYSILWIYFIFEGGTLTISLDLTSITEDMDIQLRDVDVALSIKGFIMIIYMLILLRMILAFTKYGSNRDKYLEMYHAVAADRDYEPSRKTTFKEDLKEGSFGRGMGSAILKLVIIVLIPCILIHYSDTFIEATNLDTSVGILDFMLGILYRFSMFGIPLVFLGFFTKFYKEGNKAWLMFRMLSLAYMMVWVLMIFEMGEIEVPVESELLYEVEGYIIGIFEIVWSIIIIIMLYILFKMVAALATFKSKRIRYLRNLEESADGNQHSD